MAATPPRERSAALETILLVDDEDAVRGLAVEALTRRGYQVLQAASGGDALEAARTESSNIKLLITDVMMPDMNGRELTRQMRDLVSDIRVIVMSGYPDDEIDLQASGRTKGVYFLQKPFSMAALAAKVREALDQ